MRIRRRKVGRSLLAAVAVALALPGCEADTTAPEKTPDATAVQATTVTDGSGAPNYGSLDEVPPSFKFAKVNVMDARVGWDGSLVQGYGMMQYFGDRARISFNLKVVHDFTTTITDSYTVTHESLLPDWQVLGAPYEMMTGSDCGQTANLAIDFSASTVVLVDWALTTIGSDADNAQTHAPQPQCPTSPPAGGQFAGGDDNTRCDIQITYDRLTGDILDVDVIACYQVA